MESHPIPQNVTSFEFHLVGDMTLKQFGYLSGGIGMAYLVFILFGSAFPIIAWPIILISSALGVAFAFLPIQERPLDHWLGAFFKAIFRPTQLKFLSSYLKIEDPNFGQRLNLYLTSLHGPIPANIASPAPQSPPALKPVSKKAGEPEPLPSPSELKETVSLAQQAQTIKSEILKTESQLNKIKQSAAQPGSTPKEFTAQFASLMSELQTLNQKAGVVSKELANLSKTPPLTTKQSIKAKSVPTLTLTTTANIINGIVIDAQGNYLENAIIVAHDRQALPVRALKTNKLGQFIAATPLPSGTYTINIEKDGLSFDQIEVELKGELLRPIIIQAQKVVPL